MKTVRVLAAAAALSFAAANTLATVVTYDPSLGTLPTAQGWTFGGTTLAGANASSGTLTYGPTTTSGTTFWNYDLPDNTMDFSTTTWSMTANVRLSGATWGNVSGFRRGGFVMLLADDAGRWITADIGDNSISLRNDNNGTSDPSASVSLTGSFHTVQLVASPTGGQLFVDGTLRVSLAMGSGFGSRNYMSFGEGSILASAASTEIGGIVVVPAPAPALALGCVGLFAARRRR